MKKHHGIGRLRKKEHMIFFHSLEMKKNMRPWHLHSMQHHLLHQQMLHLHLLKRVLSERPHRMRSIQELYDDREEITNF
uniref:Putative ovule protein n=1 Tax=Solanum chacoense TaxID=4108 RepID=A0A0V0HHX9_SOLCH